MEQLFICDLCGKEFEKTWSDEEAIREAQENFGDVDMQAHAVVCDDCYKEFMEWYKENGPDRKVNL